ncbi:hypothetical protein HO173_005002 [Letharia columbiana]|uniref:Uncharacterized protein n=1 Tax=Letharia columbiana TaxID=112416 RepID=A0A8H6L5W7_9LECA|nr:uncharacterized protein HO173_005002 [Letharia columbiana]KAF6236711.1 hypothetical protein HO173_005002 [Letharia columbiana]
MTLLETGSAATWPSPEADSRPSCARRDSLELVKSPSAGSGSAARPMKPPKPRAALCVRPSFDNGECVSAGTRKGKGQGGRRLAASEPVFGYVWGDTKAVIAAR